MNIDIYTYMCSGNVLRILFVSWRAFDSVLQVFVRQYGIVWCGFAFMRFLLRRRSERLIGWISWFLIGWF